MSATNNIFTQTFISQPTQDRLSELKQQFYNNDAIEALSGYKKLIVDTDDEFEKRYIKLILSLQYLKAGFYQNSHLLLIEVKPDDDDQGDEITKEVYFNLEWILVARKVYLKQYFYQKCLETLQAGSRICFDWSKKDPTGSPKLNIYRAKIFEGLGLLYAESYFYKTGKEYMIKAMNIYDSDTSLDKNKFNLKYANFYKKSGFYVEGLQRIEKLESEDIQDEGLKFRIVRDHARVLSILNRVDEAIATFDRAEKLLNENKLKSLKYGKLVFLKGLASKRISCEKALEVFTESLEIFENILKTENS